MNISKSEFEDQEQELWLVEQNELGECDFYRIYPSINTKVHIFSMHYFDEVNESVLENEIINHVRDEQINNVYH